MQDVTQHSNSTRAVGNDRLSQAGPNETNLACAGEVLVTLCREGAQMSLGAYRNAKIATPSDNREELTATPTRDQERTNTSLIPIRAHKENAFPEVQFQPDNVSE
eukprot:872074-Pyramimonas_sp.AAC.1